MNTLLTIRCRPLAAGLLVLLLMGMLPPAHPLDAADEDPRIAEAREKYMFADYDGALTLLTQLSQDQALTDEEKRETFRLMGMVYTVMDDRDAALQMVRKWVSMEPPRVEANPDNDLLDFVHVYYQVRKEVNEQKFCEPAFDSPHPCQYGIDRPDPGIKTIAIIDFDNNSIDDRERLDPLKQGLADLMIRQLNGATNLQIVEREQLNWLLGEIDLNQTGRMSPETAVRIGKLMGAHSVMLGDYMYFNKRLSIGVRLVKVETSEILLTATENGKLDEFAQITGKLSEKFAEAVGSKLEPKVLDANTPTNSLEAMMAYADGLALYDAGNLKGAYDKFSQALDHDPNYLKAQERFDALQPVIAKAARE